MLHLPSALLLTKSMYTLHNAVLTEWNCLYADWNWGKQSKILKCFSNCCRQANSITSDKTKYFIKAGMNSKYFYHYLTEELFSHLGKVPDLKEQLTRMQYYSASFSSCSILKVSISKASLRQKFSFIFLMKIHFCSIVTGVNTHMVFKGKSGIEKITSELWQF